MNFLNMIYLSNKKSVIYTIVLICLYGCAYDESSHMSNEELSFIACMSAHDTIIYKSSSGCFIDTIIVDSISIYNSNPLGGRWKLANPFTYLEVSKVYESHASCNFRLKHNCDSYYGWFLAKKLVNKNDSLSFSFNIGRVYCFDKLLSNKEDDVVFNQSDIHISKYQNSIEDISAITFKKGIGILYYKFSETAFQKCK